MLSYDDDDITHRLLLRTTGIVFNQYFIFKEKPAKISVNKAKVGEIVE